MSCGATSSRRGIDFQLQYEMATAAYRLRSPAIGASSRCGSIRPCVVPIGGSNPLSLSSDLWNHRFSQRWPESHRFSRIVIVFHEQPPKSLFFSAGQRFSRKPIRNVGDVNPICDVSYQPNNCSGVLAPANFLTQNSARKLRKPFYKRASHVLNSHDNLRSPCKTFLD